MDKELKQILEEVYDSGVVLGIEREEAVKIGKRKIKNLFKQKNLNKEYSDQIPKE